MAFVNVGKVANFVVNGPPVDISDKFAPNAPKRMVTRFADAPGGAPQLSAVSSICIHLGCPILTGSPEWATAGKPIYDPTTKVITCPCHGSRIQCSDRRSCRRPSSVSITHFCCPNSGDGCLRRQRSEPPARSPTTTRPLAIPTRDRSGAEATSISWMRTTASHESRRATASIMSGSPRSRRNMIPRTSSA